MNDPIDTTRRLGIVNVTKFFTRNSPDALTNMLAQMTNVTRTEPTPKMVSYTGQSALFRELADGEAAPVYHPKFIATPPEAPTITAGKATIPASPDNNTFEKFIETT